MSPPGGVKCLYCGGDVPAHSADCPHCGAPSHFQQQGENPRRRRRFIIYVILVSLFCLAMIVYLPR